MSLEASEYARDAGRFDSFHGRVFRAYFTETRDIGDLDVLLELAQEEGLDAADLRVALREGRYASRLDEAHSEGRAVGNQCSAHVHNQWEVHNCGRSIS